MAVLGYFRRTENPAIVLADTTYSPAANNSLGARTDQFNLGGLASGAYRQSDKVDTLATRGDELFFTACLTFASAPVSAELIGFFWAPSHSNVAAVGNPGGVSGSDSVYLGYSNNAADAVKHLISVSSMVCTVQATQISVVGRISASERYGSLVVHNGSSDAFGAATDIAVRILPLISVIEDS